MASISTASVNDQRRFAHARVPPVDSNVAVLVAAVAGVSPAVPNVVPRPTAIAGTTSRGTQTNLVSNLGRPRDARRSGRPRTRGVMKGPATPLQVGERPSPTPPRWRDPVNLSTDEEPGGSGRLPGHALNRLTGQVFNGGAGFWFQLGTWCRVSTSSSSSTLTGAHRGLVTPPIDPLTLVRPTMASTPARVYTDLAISSTNDLAFAADFAGGKVDVFDSTAPVLLGLGVALDPGSCRLCSCCSASSSLNGGIRRLSDAGSGRSWR